MNDIRMWTSPSDCLDVVEKGTVSVTGLWDAGRVKGTNAMNEAYSMGHNV